MNINLSIILILLSLLPSCNSDSNDKEFSLGNVVNNGFDGLIYLQGAKCFDADSLNTILEKSSYYDSEQKKFVFDNKHEKLYFLFSVRNEEPCNCAISLISYIKDENGKFHSITDQGKAVEHHDILAEKVLPSILAQADSAQVSGCDSTYFFNF